MHADAGASIVRIGHIVAVSDVTWLMVGTVKEPLPRRHVGTATFAFTLSQNLVAIVLQCLHLYLGRRPRSSCGDLVDEHIQGIDAFLALTGHDEDNIISSMLSKRLGARKAIALINRLDFLPMAQLLGINSAFSTRLVVVDRIMGFVRKGKVQSVTTFREEEAEAIELIATADSKYVGKRLCEVHLPHGAIVGAIVRPTGEALVPRGDAMIQPGDRVLFFCLEYLVPQLESAFIAGK